MWQPCFFCNFAYNVNVQDDKMPAESATFVNVMRLVRMEGLISGGKVHKAIARLLTCEQMGVH